MVEIKDGESRGWIITIHDECPHIDGTEFTEVVNPFFDYVSPEHIDIFVTNVYVVQWKRAESYACLCLTMPFTLNALKHIHSGGHTPAYIYRLLSENYDQRDQSLKAAPIGK